MSELPGVDSSSSSSAAFTDPLTLQMPSTKNDDILNMNSNSDGFNEFAIDSDDEGDDINPFATHTTLGSKEEAKGASFNDIDLAEIEQFCLDDEVELEVTPSPVTSPSSATAEEATMGSITISTSTSSGMAVTSEPVAAVAPTPLLKKSVSATEDPLSGLWDTSTSATNSSTSSFGTAVPRPQHVSKQPTFNTSNVMANGKIPHSPKTSRNVTPTTRVQSIAANAKAPSATFSSTFSSFASKFQDAVSTAAGTNLNSFSDPINHNLNANPATMAGGASLTNRAMNSGSGQQGAPLLSVRNVPASLTPPQLPTVYGSGSGLESPRQAQDMDTTKKTALVNSAIGNLLPGERVIMFLSNLGNVRCSSSPHMGVGSMWENKSDPSQQDLVWCCAMTYYRIILFNYHEADFKNIASEEIFHEKTTSEINPLSPELQLWIQTASISRQYQHLQSTYTKPNGKRHHVIQMPLASIDRIGNSSEYTSNVSAPSQLSSLMGGTGFSSTSDSVGNNVTNKSLVIYGKDNGRFIQFTANSYADCLRALKALNSYAFPGRKNLGYLFAFESRREEVMNSVKTDDGAAKGGPSRVTARATLRRYDALEEFQRMVGPQVSEENQGGLECPWRPYLKANASYNLCTSYPNIIFGPSSISDETPEGMRLLRETAAFRSGTRTITMTWASRFDGASLWRCAQPKVGLQGNRCTADEYFIKRISESSALANSQASINGKIPPRPSLNFLKMLTGGNNENDLMLESFAGNNVAFNEKCMLKIFDLRPKSSAIANKTAGYGYENTSNYKNSTLSFHGIGNIHAVRDAYQKISTLCLNQTANDAKWSQLVEDTNWLSQIRAILSASWQAAFHIRYNRLPIIVRCSHGWDRTSQVCALTQLFLDPYYRTRAGFSCLVSKDFLALGHPFHTRCGHGEGRGERGGGSSSNGQGDEGQVSPIFLQFLDCVFQIVDQFPEYFEFNTKYLLVLSEHVYSCRFGTLLCDTERERELVATIRQRTHCLWEYLDSLPDLINQSFSSINLKPDDFEGDGTLMMPLSTLLRNVTLWMDRHCMHGVKPTIRSVSNRSKILELSTEQPLYGSRDIRDDALREALEQVSVWKAIALEKEEEIVQLKKEMTLT